MADENAVEKPSQRETPKYTSPKNRMESMSDPSVARVTPSLRPTLPSILPQHQGQRDAARQSTRERRSDEGENGDGLAVHSVLVEERHAPDLSDAVRDEGGQHHEDQQMHAHQLFAVGTAAVDPDAEQHGEDNGHDLHERKHAGRGSGKMAVKTHRNDVTGDVSIVDGGIADTQNQEIIIIFRDRE